MTLDKVILIIDGERYEFKDAECGHGFNESCEKCDLGNTDADDTPAEVCDICCTMGRCKFVVKSKEE